MDYKTWHFLTWVMSDNWRFALPINKAKPYQRRFRTFLLAWFGMIVSSLHAVFIHFANKNKLKKSMQLSKNMIKNYFTIFCKKMSIFVRNSSNFLHTIFIPQATIGTKNPLNPAKIGAKTTPLFYKRRNKIVKPRSMNWSIKRWIVENGLAVILTPKSTSWHP